MTALVLVENEVTAGGRYDHWQDVTGERYQFPNQYRNKVQPGRPFVYYRGVRRPKGTRGAPEYFGTGVIGAVYPDPSNTPGGPKARWKWICDIEDFQPFPIPVLAKEGGTFLEKIPSNLWGVAVRDLPTAVYQAILSKAGLAPVASTPASLPSQFPPLDKVEPTVASCLFVTKGPQTTASSGHPTSAPRRSRYSAALGRRGEEVVLAHLRATLTPAEASTLRWVSEAGEHPGWDIEFRSSGQLIAVEVKATGGPAFPSIEVTANEWVAAQTVGANYRLCLVAEVRGTTPRIQMIENPAAMVAAGTFGATPSGWRLVQLTG